MLIYHLHFKLLNYLLLIYSINLHVQPLLQNTIKAHDKKGYFSSQKGHSIILLYSLYVCGYMA